MAQQENKNPVYGVVARFADSDGVLEAAKAAHAAGYRVMDAYSPVPVHGLDEALGRPRSWLAWMVFAGGLTGCLAGFMLQVWVSVWEYPVNVGGRPFFSWPSFIPVAYETTILGAALTAVFGMFGLNGLPKPFHPIFYAEDFERASADRYFLCIESTDPRFDESAVTAFLREQAPESVSTVHNPAAHLMG